MRQGSFLSERVIGWLIGAGVAGILLGVLLITGGARRALYSYTNLDLINARTHLGEILVAMGVIVAGIGLVAGLLIAFGFGPSRRLENALVEERMVTLSDGSPVFSDIPDDQPLKYYLRLRTPAGDVFEARCNREVFYAVQEQTIGTATVAGEQLLSFVQTGIRRRSIP